MTTRVFTYKNASRKVLSINPVKNWLLRCLFIFIFIAFFVLTFSYGRSTAYGNKTIWNLPLHILKNNSVDDLPGIREKSWLRALVTFSKTDFFFYYGQPKGLHAEILSKYENFLNQESNDRKLPCRIAFMPVPFNRLISDLIDGKGDIAAAGLTVTEKRASSLAFVPMGISEVNEVVVTRKNINNLNKLEDLSNRNVYVLAGSSYVEHLRELNSRLQEEGIKPIKICEADPLLLTEDILEMVNAGIVEITIADDYKASQWSQVLTGLHVHQNLQLHTNGKLGWAVRKSNPKLIRSLRQFSNQVKEGTFLGNLLIQRYYENNHWLQNPLEKADRIKFGKYIPLFKKYGEKYNIDFLAIAAQAYHESRLDHKKKSSRGAVGIMQLLPSTAAGPNVGIPHIENVENNVHAGTKYLVYLRDTYFTDTNIRNHDRLAFAWAAYNAGPSKVKQMREHTKSIGLDPDKWFQNVEYAAADIVGRETVHYVANVYKYYVAYRLVENILENKTSKDEPRCSF
jgi:membrane-bound lytic murein transglycosylase MltF